MKNNKITKIGTITLAGAVLIASPLTAVYCESEKENKTYCKQDTHDWKDTNGDYFCDICGGELPELPDNIDLGQAIQKGLDHQDYIPQAKASNNNEGISAYSDDVVMNDDFGDEFGDEFGDLWNNYKDVSIILIAKSEDMEDIENFNETRSIKDYSDLVLDVENFVLGRYPTYSGDIIIKDTNGDTITEDNFNIDTTTEVYISIIKPEIIKPSEPENTETESTETEKKYPYTKDHNGNHDSDTHTFKDEDGDQLCDLCGGKELGEVPSGSNLGEAIQKGEDHSDVIPGIPNTESTETTESTEEPSTETSEEPSTETSEEPSTETSEEPSTETSETESTETEETSTEETSTEETSSEESTEPEETSTEYGKVDPDDPEGETQLTWTDSTETESTEEPSTETSEEPSTESTEETSETEQPSTEESKTETSETESTTEEGKTEETTSGIIDTSDTQHKNYGMYFLISAMACVLPVFKKFVVK